MKSIQVLLADPHPLIRAALRLLLTQMRGVTVQAEVGTGTELLEQLTARRPDVLITEMNVPGAAAIEVARRIARHLPGVRVLLLSTQIDSAQVQSALKAGVLGFVSKAGDPAELEIALRAVTNGNPYLSPHFARFAIDRRRSRQDVHSVRLPTRQREVLQMLGRGKTTKEIASLLGLSVKTVETHRARLMQALDLNNINALLHYAVRHEVEDGTAV